jgi:dihydroneopterin aldolase
MQKVLVNGVKVRANHGCWPEEEIIGGDYIVDVEMSVNFLPAAQTDDLNATADYVDVVRIIYHEMALRSKLIETVAYRIASSILKNVRVECVSVKVTKISPPAGGDVQSVSVECVLPIGS